MKKDILLVVLVLVSVGLVVALVGIFEKNSKVSKSLEEERYNRMVVEESLQKSAAKVATLEAQLKVANDKMVKVQEFIDQEKTVNADLQKQYEELSKTRANLEAKLKNTVEEKASASVQSAASSNPTVMSKAAQ